MILIKNVGIMLPVCSIFLVVMNEMYVCMIVYEFAVRYLLSL
jgi:hypothetical protein